MTGKSIVTYITVTAEDGTSKEYKLIIINAFNLIIIIINYI